MQGENRRKAGPENDDALLIPLTLPLIAGPGAIATVIAISARGGAIDSVLVAMVAVAVVAVVTFVTFNWLGGVPWGGPGRPPSRY